MGKKYLFLLPTLELGGAERQALNLASYLNKTGSDAFVASLARTGSLLDVCRQEGIRHEVFFKEPSLLSFLFKSLSFFVRRILRKPYWDGVRYALYLALYLKRNCYEAVLSYCASANTVAGLSKYFYKGTTKVVWCQRDAGIYNCPDVFQRRAIRKADVVLANSISGQKFIKETYGLDAQIIYNGVSLRDIKYTADEWRAKLGIDGDTLVAVMVANLSGAKDHMTLLKAWTIVCRQLAGQKIRLLLAGRFDDQYESLWQFVEDNKLEDTVTFLGQVDDVTGILHISNIAVFAAKSEGSPNGVIEACLASLPVAATDLPEIREVLDESNYDYMSPRENPERLAENIIRLFRSQTIREAIGRSNKKKAMSLFMPEKNFERTVKVIGNACI